MIVPYYVLTTAEFLARSLSRSANLACREFRDDSQHGWKMTRLRSGLKLARPYIWRLNILIYLMVSLTCAELQGRGRPLVTACWSVRILDTTGAPAAARRTLARQSLEAEARHLSVSLEVGAPFSPPSRRERRCCISLRRLTSCSSTSP
jgi:hypothetical protein